PSTGAPALTAPGVMPRGSAPPPPRGPVSQAGRGSAGSGKTPKRVARRCDPGGSRAGARTGRVRGRPSARPPAGRLPGSRTPRRYRRATFRTTFVRAPYAFRAGWRSSQSPVSRGIAADAAVGHVDTIVCTGRNMGAGKFRAELYFAIVSGNPAGVGDVGGV